MKLKLYTSQDKVDVPKAMPQGDLATAGAPGRAAAGALAEVSQQSMKWAQLQYALDKQKKDTEAAIEATQARVQYARELADSEIKRRNSPEFDMSTHDQWLQDEGNRIIEKIAGGLKSPDAANAFRKASTSHLGEKTVGVKYEYAGHLEKRATAAHFEMGKTLEAESLNAPDVMVETLVDQYDRAGRALIGRVDGYNEASVAKMTQDFREKVWGQRVEREARTNPDAVMAKLAEKNADGTWKHYKGLSEEQRTKGFGFSERLSEHKAEQKRLAEERAERKLKLEKAEQYENLMSDLTIRATQGKLSLDELVATGVKERIRDRDYNFLFTLVRNQGSDLPSDAKVLFALSQDVYSLSPKASMDALRQARLAHLEGRAGINQSDFEKLAGRLTESQKYWRGEIKDEHRYRYTKAKEYLESRLKVSEFGDPNKVNKMYELIGRAQEMLFHESTNGKADPNAVVQRLLPRFLREAKEIDVEDRERVIGLLGLPKNATPKQVREAYDLHKQMKPEPGSRNYLQWENRAKLFLEWDEIDQELNDRDITIQRVDENNQNTAPRSGGSRSGSEVPLPGSPVR